MTPDSAQAFGVALMALWGTAGAVALGRQAAKSPAARELAAAVRRMNLAAKCALVAGLVGAVAIGGTKPGGTNEPPNRLLSPIVGTPVTNTPPFALVEVRTNGVALVAASTNAVVSESVRRRGTSEGGEWIETETPFFRWGTNPVSRVFASPAVLSFGTMRHPAIGATLPDGSPAESLVALRTPLGLAPEANWPHLSAPSRFWHEATPFGRVFTWENSLVDRETDRPATIQIEAWDDGDFVYRYDFSDAAPTNGFFIGAQLGSAAVEALGVRGGVTNAAMVYRVDGAPVPSGVFVADFFTAPRLELRWRNVAGLCDLSGDEDGDGLSDWDEIFRYDTDPHQSDTDGDGLSDSSEILSGANPLDTDENGDGIPDGVSAEAWTSDPIWAENSGKTNLVVTLGTAIPDGAAASLVLGSVTIPLRSARHYVFGIPVGVEVPFRLFSRGVAAVDLSMSNALPGQPAPLLRSSPNWPQKEFNGPCLRLHDLLGVFDGKQAKGEGFVAGPRIYLRCESGNDDMVASCIHGDGFCVYSIVTEPASCSFELHEADEIDGFQIQQGKFVSLHVTDEPGDSDYGYIRFGPKYHCWGDADIYHGIHRCEGGPLTWCAACGMFHDEDDEHSCPHQTGCPSKTNATSACTCPIPVIRVEGTGTPLSEFAELDFPDEAYCCCSRPMCFTYARWFHIDSNLSVWDGVSPSNLVEAGQCPVSATVYATGESGNAPSEIEYQLVRRHYDGNGSVVSNEVFGTRTLRIWAINATLEPVTTTRIGNQIINPCGIIIDEPATFRMEVSPAAFPDSLIEWTATPENRVQFVGNVRTGRQVSVTGNSQGDVTLTAHITGYSGPPPIVRARVMPRTTVPVNAWIVCGTNGVPAIGESVLRGKFPEINRIWDQAGITWQLAEVNFVTNQAWMTIEDNDSQNALHSSICSYGNAPWGVELYCIGSIEHAEGLTSPKGCVVVGTATPNVFAHEFGHLCNLKDIYPRRPRKTDLTVTGAIARDRLERDWSSAVEEGYYPAGLQQGNLIKRMLMCGIPTATGVRTDVSSGDVYGLWWHWRKAEDSDHWDWFHDLGTVPVGFHLHGDKQPIVEQ